MRAVIQRTVSSAVTVIGPSHNETVAAIGHGLTVLLGVEEGDTAADARYIADKIAGLRIFDDENGKLNRSLQDIKGEILLISQFTLLGDARNGRRPSYSRAARAETANALYEQTALYLRERGLNVATGQFQTHMHISLCNDGPVTILLDSRKIF
ncbi:MAG: D-aminoacyl-tRNA deacylase [Neisseria sp.]|nr:D-aminoacyl-tRNA deacylase [Neisseria sp.]